MVKEYRFDILKFVFSSLGKDIKQANIRGSLETWVLEVVNKSIYFEENSTVSDNTGYLICKDWCREVE